MEERRCDRMLLPMGRKGILLAALAVLAALPAVAAARTAVSVPAPTFTLDPATKHVTLTFTTPADFKPAWLVVGESPTLNKDGNITNTAGGGDVTSSPFTYTDWGSEANGWPTVLYFQIAYSCLKYPPTECPGGQSVIYGAPVKVDLAAAAKKPDAKQKPATAELGAVPKANGTRACTVARNKLIALNGEIKKAVANLNFQDKLGNSPVQATRTKQLQKRLAALEAQIPAAVAAAKTACGR